MKKTLTLVFAMLAFGASALPSEEFSAELLGGEVAAQISATPAQVDPARELMVRITLEYPAGVSVSMPDLQDRFAGFSLAEDFETEPVTAGDRTRQSATWRLIPIPGAERYRLAPFALEIVDARGAAPISRSVATAPVLFPPPAVRPVVTGDPEADDSPFHVPPTAGEIAVWAGWVAAAAVLVAVVVVLAGRIRRTVRLLRLSPSQRALEELERLVEMDLPGKGMFKTFYVEVTQVVRRYVERVSGVKAPTMTTDEFLVEVSAKGAFAERKVEMVRFLRSADMIKFAGVEATRAMADLAIADAKGFVAPVANGEGGAE